MKNRLVTYNDNRIILSHERESEAVIDIYPSHHLLTYIREGVLKVQQGSDVRFFYTGEFVLLKKYTQATITKSWGENEVKFSSIVFTFQEELIENVFAQLSTYPIHIDKNQVINILGILSNPVLNQFIQSLQMFFDEGIEMDTELAKLKTTEAVIGIIRTNEKLAHQLKPFSIKSKADLHAYMNAHYLANKKLITYARETGRSITTFKKDFQDLYNTTPSKWIKEKRLEYAFKILTSSNRKPSEIYLEVGFEDLAHFSRSFKQQFGTNPSEIKKTF